MSRFCNHVAASGVSWWGWGAKSPSDSCPKGQCDMMCSLSGLLPVAQHIWPHPPSVDGAATMALSSAEPVEGCPLSTWECETGWSSGWIMYNMLIRSYDSLPAGPPQVTFAMMGLDKELTMVPWWFSGWFSGFEAAAWMFKEMLLGWNFGRQNAAE